jgi:DNA polymerase-3 subunit gamma/tau
VSAAAPSAPAAASSTPAAAAAAAFDGDWPGLAARLQVGGFVQQFMHQSELIEADGLRFRVRVPIRPLADAAMVNRVREALGAHFGAPVRLDVDVGKVGGATAAAASAHERAERQAQAQAAIESDPFVRGLIADFDASILPGSVRPVGRRDTDTTSGECE